MLQLEIVTENKELASICELYWEVDSNLDFVHKVSEIAELANINKTKLTTDIRDACLAFVSDWKCSECGAPYVFSGRTDFTRNRSLLVNNSYHQRTLICRRCKTVKKEKEIIEKKQQEESARQDRKAIEIKMRKEIREKYDLSNRQLSDVKDLSLTDTIYLISMLRGGVYENLNKIMPVSMFEQKLSSDSEFSTEIINHLYKKGLIYVHPDSDIKAFEQDDISTFYIYHVEYAPPISKTSPDDPKALLSELFHHISCEWSEEWCQEALNLWKKVALYECKEYLLFVLKEHHFEFSPGEKTLQYLGYALEHFSTAQVFNIIWRATKDAAAYYQREGISKRQAANVAIAALQRNTERAVAESWDIKPFRRNFNCPQALVSEILYNLAIKIGEGGINLVPNIESIRVKKHLPKQA